MSSVRSISASLQSLLLPFSEDIVGDKLRVCLETQAAHVFHHEPTSIQHHILKLLVPRLSNDLDKLVAELGVEEVRNPGKPLLSVQSLRVVYTVVELLWQWGMAPTLLALSPEYMPPVLQFPSSLLAQKRSIEWVSAQLTSAPATVATIIKLTSTMAAIISNDTFSGLMLQRNLDRLMFSYLVLSNSDKVNSFPNDEDAALCKEMSSSDITTEAVVSLRNLYEGPFASVVVSKLRSFTKGPPWLRDASCAILTNILQGPRGVETVLSGYLDGSLDSAYAAALQAHVAKLITTAPAGFTASEKETYFVSITEQVKDLLLYGLFKNDKTLMRVCVLMVQRLAVVCPAVCAADLLAPLTAPLLSVLPTHIDRSDGKESGEVEDSDDEIVDIPIRTAYVYEKYLYTNNSSKNLVEKEIVWIKDPAVRADALCLQSCVELLHLLLTLCPLHRSLVHLVCSLKIDTTMLQLYNTLLPHQSTNNVRGKVDAQLFETVESFCVNLFKFVGTRMVCRVERFLYTDINLTAAQVNMFTITNQGLVEVRSIQSISSHGMNEGERVSSIADVLSQARHASDIETSSYNTGRNLTSALEGILHTLQDRLKAIVALLVLFEDSITARAAQMEVTTNTPTKSNTTAATTANSVPSSSSTNKQTTKTTTTTTTTTSTYEYLASELFLRSLAGFLHLPAPAVDSSVGLQGSNSVNNRTDIFTDTFELSVDAALYGAVVLALQEQLPFSALLRDGLQILRLLKTFVEHYANHLSISPADMIIDDAEVDAESVTSRAATSSLIEIASTAQTSPSPAAASGRRPLIEEISPSGALTERSTLNPVTTPTNETVESAAGEDLITPVLSLLATILHLGHALRSAAEEALIRSLLPPLQTIAFRATPAITAVQGNQNTLHVDEKEDGAEEAGGDVAQTASDVALMILSRSYQQSHPSATLNPSTSADSFSTTAETFLQLIKRMQSNAFLFSESPAMRGYATRILLQNMQHRTQTLSVEDATAALDALLPLLSDQESFVYLNALVALRQLSECSPKIVFKALLEVFAGSEEHQQQKLKDQPASIKTKVVDVSSGAVPTLPQARRAMVGEALVMLLQRALALKNSRPVFRLQIIELLPTLVQVCLVIAQRRFSSIDAAVLDAAVDLQAMRITARQAEDQTVESHVSSKMITNYTSDDKSTSITANADANNNHTALVEAGPQVSTSELERAIATADADILRQSAVSLLAEALVLAGPASYRYLDDVMDLALGVLNLEQGHGQSVRAARRAAAYLASRAVTLLCESLGVESLLRGQKSRTLDSFQHNYEALQRAALHDTDEVVKFHASRGLFALQDLYAKLFAVPENTEMMDARVVDMLRIVK